jgi:hypothetical protein
MPTHTHTQDAHTHGVTTADGYDSWVVALKKGSSTGVFSGTVNTSGTQFAGGLSGTDGYFRHGGNNSVTATNQNTGEGQVFDKRPQTLTLNYVIYATDETSESDIGKIYWFYIDDPEVGGNWVIPIDDTFVPAIGQTLETSEYPELYDVIGTTFGGGDGGFETPYIDPYDDLFTEYEKVPLSSAEINTVGIDGYTPHFISGYRQGLHVKVTQTFTRTTSTNPSNYYLFSKGYVSSTSSPYMPPLNYSNIYLQNPIGWNKFNFSDHRKTTLIQVNNFSNDSGSKRWIIGYALLSPVPASMVVTIIYSYIAQGPFSGVTPLSEPVKIRYPYIKVK